MSKCSLERRSDALNIEEEHGDGQRGMEHIICRFGGSRARGLEERDTVRSTWARKRVV